MNNIQRRAGRIIGGRLREMFELKKTSSLRVAHTIGFNASTLERYMNGYLDIPYTRFLQIIHILDLTNEETLYVLGLI